MTKLNETSVWEDDIYQISRGDKVSGGRDGNANIQARQLAGRTNFLKGRIEDIDTDIRKDMVSKSSLLENDATEKIAMPLSGTLKDVIDYYTLDAFGLKDGEDVTSRLQQIAALQKVYGFRLRQHIARRFKLKGSSGITFHGTCDFSGVIWEPEGFTGGLNFTQRNAAVTYDASTVKGKSLLDSINGSAWQTREAQRSKLGGLVNDDTLNNHMVIFGSSSLTLFTSRNKARGYKAVNRVSKKGKLDRALRYSMPASIDSVYALPVGQEEIFISPGCFDMKGNPHAVNIKIFDITRAVIENSTALNRPVLDTGSAVDLSIDGGYNIRFKNVYSPWPNDSYNTAGSAVYSYTLNYNNIFRLHISDSCSQGEGWGATAGANCQDITFDYVDFNRIDFHEPFSGYCRIINSHLGNHAISICGTADSLEIRDCTATLEAGQDDAGIIKGRDDQGGFNDCHLIIDGLIINGDPGNRSALIRSNSDGTGSVPEGSPVTPWMFSTVTLRNIRWAERKETSRFDSLFSSNTNGLVYFPRKVIIDNCDYLCGDDDGVGFVIDFTNFRQDYSRLSSNDTPTLSAAGYTTLIEMRNMDACRLVFKGAGVAHNPKVTVYSLGNSRKGEGAPPVNITQRGTYEFHGSDIQYIQYKYAGNNANGTVIAKVIGGAIRCPSGLPIRDSSDEHFTDLIGTSILADFDNTDASAGPLAVDIAKNLARYALMKGCTLFRKTGLTITSVPLFTGVIDTPAVTLNNFYIRAGNQIEVQCLFDSVNVLDTITLTNTAGKVGKQLYSGVSSKGYMLDISAAGNKAKINSGFAPASIRQISIKSGY